MTEIELLTEITNNQQIIINLLTSGVIGLGFIAAGQFWFLIRYMMRERLF